MKKLFVLIAAMIFSTSMFAQMGVTVGYQQKTFNSYSENGSVSVDTKDQAMNGFSVGIFYDIELMDRLALRPGINYEYSTYLDEGQIVTTKLYDNNLSIPVRLKFELLYVKGFSLSLMAGPSFDLGLSLTGETETKVVGSIITTEIPNGYKKNDNGFYTKSFNLLLGGGVALAYQNFELGIMTDWGLLNLYGGDNIGNFESYCYANKPISVRLAYVF